MRLAMIAATVIVALVLLPATMQTAGAADLSDQTLSQMGLSNVERLSDDQGDQIQGKYSFRQRQWRFGTLVTNTTLPAIQTWSWSGGGFSVSMTQSITF